MPIIRLDNRDISYNLKTSRRARYVRLSMYRGGDFVVTVPMRASLSNIETILLQKARWILSKLYLLSKPKPVRLAGSRRDYLKSREATRSFVTARLAYWRAQYPFEFNSVRIKNHKAIWGSCSAKKNLNFNYRLIELQSGVADYVIVHELCHTLELNHSRRFWSLVEKFLPNYRELRGQLKANSIR